MSAPAVGSGVPDVSPQGTATLFAAPAWSCPGRANGPHPTAAGHWPDRARAARFYYLQKQAFGGKVAEHTFGVTTTTAPRLNLLRMEEELSLAHLRLSRTTIEQLDWASCIARYDRPHTLFYCDPPYWGTEGYGVDFGLEHYEKLAGMGRDLAGRMIISVNDIPQMRAVFQGFEMESVPIRYSLNSNQPTQRRELIITVK
uniref:DNA adenine methylase n=1 Tax=Glossina brevipalpis TaxID=37001 RepID=A0A1A9WW72_9MUSC